MFEKIREPVFLLSFCLVLVSGSSIAMPVRLKCGVTDKNQRWQSAPAAWASDGQILKAVPGHYSEESAPAEVHLTKAGKYYAAVRYWEEKDKRSNFAVLVRNSALETVHFEKVDWNKYLPTARSYKAAEYPQTSGPAWHSFSFTAEFPGDYCISLLPLIYKGAASWRQIDCMLLSAEPMDDLAKFDLSSLNSLPPAEKVRKGFALPGPFPFIGNVTPVFPLGIINCGSTFSDPASQIYLGFTHDHAANYYLKGTVGETSGIKAMLSPFSDYQPDLQKKYPKPQGRFVNANGEVGNSFSLHFSEFWDEVNLRALAKVRQHLEEGNIDQVCISGEWGGFYDYSELAIAKFRLFLEERYQDCARLNATWNASYSSWQEVQPPKTVEENPAAYYDFQEFSGKTFAKLLAARAARVRQEAPNVKVTSQLSNLNIFGADFKKRLPMDYEEIFNIVFRPGDLFGWDGYCADDYMGAEVDFLDSMSHGIPIVNQETNVHTEDPFIMSRTFWTMVGKGVKGIYLFMFQEGVFHDSYPKWALLNGDFSHKDKLGSAADIAHEVHRLEPFFTAAQRAYAVKPVYVYYSRLDSLYHGPLLSSWSEGANSPYRVYELLRAAGYAVRYITAEQICAGGLEGAGALVLSQSERIPAEASRKISAWIQSGGIAIADMLPGIKDRADRTDLSLMRLFGVEPAAKEAPAKSVLALQESSQGYGEVTINAIENKDIPSSVFEIWQQFDSQHPMLRGIAPYTFSGFGRQKVNLMAGETVGMSFGGVPALVVNEPGQGKTLYLAGMLGSVYGGSCSRYEFDDAHAGSSPHRLIASFLSWAGLSPQAKVHLEEKRARKIRVENPLVDSRGNIMFALTSFNDGAVEPFTVDTAWPQNLPKPKRFFAVVDHSRRLHPIDVLFTENNQIRFVVPGFRTYAALFGFQDFGPLLSMYADCEESGKLAQISSNDNIRFTVEVHNLSGKTLEKGELRLTLPEGWKGDREAIPVGKLRPWQSSRKYSVSMTAPEYCALRRARPASMTFHNSQVQSTPCTTMLWFEKANSENAASVK